MLHWTSATSSHALLHYILCMKQLAVFTYIHFYGLFQAARVSKRLARTGMRQMTDAALIRDTRGPLM